MDGEQENLMNKCQEFLDELEGLPVEASGETTLEALRAQLSQVAQQHGADCANCKAVLADVAETRSVLRRLAGPVPEAGPWLAKRVMGAIAARENEIEESRNGLWSSVGRLAPRLAALCAVLLMVGGTWAYEQNRAEQMRRDQMSAVEGLFGAPASSSWNDDVMAGATEGRP